MSKFYFVFAYLSLFCVGIIDNSRGPIYPSLLDKFGVEPSLGSWIFSAAALSSLCITLLSFWWQKRLSNIASSRIALFCMLFGTLSFGLWCSYGQNFYPLIIFSFIYGMGVGFLSITLNLIVAHHSHDGNRQKLFSGLHAMYGLSSLIAPFVLSLCFDLGLKWTSLFVFLSFIPMIPLCVSIKLKGKKSNIDKNVITQKIKPSLMFKVGLMMGLYVASEVLVSSRLVFFLTNEYAVDKSQATNYLSLFFLFLLLGRLIFSFFTIPLKSRTILLGSLISSVLSISIGMFYQSAFFLSLSALTMSPFFPYFMNYLTEVYPEKSDRMIALSMNYIGIMLFVMHFVFGQVVSLFGANYAFSLSIIMLCISLYILQFGLKKTNVVDMI